MCCFYPKSRHYLGKKKTAQKVGEAVHAIPEGVLGQRHLRQIAKQPGLQDGFLGYLRKPASFPVIKAIFHSPGNTQELETA